MALTVAFAHGARSQASASGHLPRVMQVNNRVGCVVTCSTHLIIREHAEQGVRPPSQHDARILARDRHDRAPGDGLARGRRVPSPLRSGR
jgi:hypothetical protein